MRKVNNPELFRNKISDKIKIHLEKNSITGNIIKLAKNLEKGIYNYTIEESNKKRIIKKWENQHFIQLYTDKLRSIFANLDSTYIIDLINNKKIKIHKIAFMTHQELRPEKWEKLLFTHN